MKKLCFLFFAIILSCSEQEIDDIDLTTTLNGFTYNLEGVPYSGRTISRYEGGNPARIMHFKDGIRHGVTLTYSQDGTLRTKMTHQMGVLHGPFHNNPGGDTTYVAGVYENGEIKEAKGYYHSGRVYREEGDEPYKVVTYYESGSIMSKLYRDDVGYQFGEEIFYYENGQMKSQGNYRGMAGKDGIFTTWDEDGNVTSEIKYHNNKVLSSN